MYKCIVYDEDNNRKIIKVDTYNKEDVYSYAKNKKLKIVKIQEYKNIFDYKKLKDKDLKIFSKQMSILLTSGCEISKILDTLISESKGKLKKILQKILREIERGSSIKDAFQNTKSFPSFYINMVSAGEVSGNLDVVMEKLFVYYEKQSKLKSKISSILIYPIVLLVTIIISFFIILIFLIPKFEDIYLDNNVKVPVLTKILIFLSHLLREDFILLITINIVVITVILYFKNTNKRLNTFFNRMMFKIPIVKSFIAIRICNKFVQSFYILISSGIQIIDSIEISAKVINNKYIYQKIINANKFIKRGSSISTSLAMIEELPSLLISMIAIGEESGKLDTVLQTLSDYYENELNTKCDLGLKYFENFIMLFIGIVVGVIVISMMIPMFDIVTSV